MTRALVTTRPRALALGRVGAGLALASAVVHLLLLDSGSLGSLVMVAMAAACLPCAWQLCRAPSASVWRMTALVDAVMLVLHVQMLGASSAQAMPGMAHGSSVDGLMILGSCLIGTQLALAAVVLLPRHRRAVS